MDLNQKQAHRWAVRAFGQDHVSNLRVRALRAVEEAVELAQALGVPKEQVSLSADVVYGRPPGDPRQEAGGALLTIAVLCEVMGESARDLFERELLRVLSKPTQHFAARNQAKIDAGLTG